MTLLKEATGETLYGAESNNWNGGGQHWLVEDRFLHIQNPNHRQNTFIQFWTLDPKDFHQMGKNYWPEHARPDNGQLAAGYDVHIELPYADGFFFMRGYRGTVVCYDLRKH